MGSGRRAKKGPLKDPQYRLCWQISTFIMCSIFGYSSGGGDVIIVRWADDFVVGFQYEDEASRFKEALRDRLKKFSLELHPEKTRLIRFGRFARRDCERFEGRSKPETFNFLGLTHFCGVNIKGKFIVGRITQRKRLTEKLHAVKAELRERMHQSIVEQRDWLVGTCQ